METGSSCRRDGWDKARGNGYGVDRECLPEKTEEAEENERKEEIYKIGKDKIDSGGGGKADLFIP